MTAIKIKRLFMWATTDRLNAFGTLVAVLISGFALYLQHGVDDRQSASERALEDLSRQMKLTDQTNNSPRPMVMVPTDYVYFDTPISVENLKLEQHFTIRNMGRGNAHNVVVTLSFRDILVASEHGGVKFAGELEMEPVRIVDGVSMSPGEETKPSDFQFPLDRTHLPQSIQGTVDTTCRDDDGREIQLRQTFSVILHLEEERPHGHFYVETEFAIGSVVH